MTAHYTGCRPAFHTAFVPPLTPLEQQGPVVRHYSEYLVALLIAEGHVTEVYDLMEDELPDEMRS